MNRRNSLVLIVICSSLLISMVSGLVITPVCTAPGDQSVYSRSVSGDTIVWTDFRNFATTGMDIYMWDPVNGEQEVCTAPGDQWFSSISGDTIVWVDTRNFSTTERDIYMWDPVNGEQQVCTEPGYQGDPVIAGDTIVWADDRNDKGDSDIYMWDPVNGEQEVCTAPGDQCEPSISGNTIVWTDFRNFATTRRDIYKWDPVNGEQEVCTEPDDQDYSDISGDTIVFCSISWVTGWNIYKWDPVNALQPVCTEPGAQIISSISGDTIVWSDRRNATTGADIYMWDPVNGEQQVCTDPGDQGSPTISGDTIVWQDSRNDAFTGKDIYKADLSKTPPIADANPDQEALVNEIVLFNGSASYDPDNDIISYDWDFGNGATGSGISTSYVYSEPGIFIVNLTVTDDDGFSDIDGTTITVVTPTDATEDTIDDIEDLNLPQGTEQSLIAQLNAAIEALNRGLPDIALKKLQDFIDKVQKERCETIPCDEADELIAIAQRIIDSITG